MATKHVFTIGLSEGQLSQLHECNEELEILRAQHIRGVAVMPALFTPEYATPVVFDLDALGRDSHAPEELRRRGFRGPIIGLTSLSRDNQSEAAEALEARFLSEGGDRLIRSPYTMRLVDAVIRSSSGRGYMPTANGREIVKITRGDGRVRIDTERNEFEVDGRAIHLSPIEMKFMAYMTRHPRFVRSRKQIIDGVFEKHCDDPRVVDSHVKRIRRKIRAATGGSTELIRTHPGAGYSLAL